MPGLIPFRRAFVSACCLAVVLACCAQDARSEELSAEQLVERSVKALGGKDRWDEIQTLELLGAFTGFSATHPFVLQRKRPNLYWFSHTNFNRPVIVGFDGETAWWDSKMLLWSGAAWPVEMPVIYWAAVEAEAEFGGPLFDYVEKGHQITSLGRTELDGESFHGLEVQLNIGTSERWYLDLETYLPSARLSTDAAALDVKKKRTFYLDYREVEGIMVPHRIEIELGDFFQEMEVEVVNLNPEIEGRVFGLPIPPGMESLRSLAGTWHVALLNRDMPGQPWMEAEATATITSNFHGGLLEEELDYVSSGRPRHVRRQRSYDRFAGTFRATVFDSFTSYLSVLEGTLEEDGRLVVTNVDSGTAWQMMGRVFHRREVIYDIEADSFKVDVDSSFDGGQNWFTKEKLTYSRK